MVRIVTLFLGALLLIPDGTGAAAPRPHAIKVTRRAYGVRVTLALPGRTFPVNALVHATATVRNVSHHTVWYLTGGSESPGTTLPEIDVLKEGTVLYPPSLPWYVPPPGPPLGAFPLKPRAKLRASTYIILRGPEVRALIELVPSRMDLQHRTKVQTPRLTVRLPPANPPAFTLLTTPGGPQVDVTPPSGVHRPPLYVSAAQCAGPNPFSETLMWERAPATTFTPGCVPSLQWHLVAGWPGYSVVQVDVPGLPSAVASPSLAAAKLRRKSRHVEDRERG